MFTSERVRAIAYQALLLAAVVGIGWLLVANTLYNLSTRQIQVGFGFLSREAGFEIAESPIVFDPSNSYGRAFLVGLLNTLRISALGIVGATLLGTLIGIARLSSNWLVARLASAYVEFVRNVPLLLQLFVWYGLITELLPPVREAIAFGDLVFLSQRGLRYAWPQAAPGWSAAGWAFAAAVVLALAWRALASRRQRATGAQWPVLWPSLGLLLLLPVGAWLAGGAPTQVDLPRLGGFDFRGGRSLSPEFIALLVGLSTYTAAFIAEVVRGGILSVPRGQAEAAMALGLKPGQRLRLVTMPQALRVIIPPLTSQYLNLTKNSSLAVAIGYPDLVAVANTTMNQTGQAIEAIAILMAVYLAISLAISLMMNWYAARTRLVER
ncbi:MAG: ABC transporter permease subunit [Lautropia sp.]|nr:ABC transporter permease subunit [Lautropia sp.]MDL1906449.1 ABC transporter permease subunit [Betaproteobacteria bacterium PRO1]